MIDNPLYISVYSLDDQPGTEIMKKSKSRMRQVLFHALQDTIQKVTGIDMQTKSDDKQRKGVQQGGHLGKQVIESRLRKVSRPHANYLMG